MEEFTRMYEEGYEAFPFGKNPYPQNSIEYSLFERGFDAAEEESYAFVTEKQDE